MTAADFRRIALSLDGAEEGSHMGAVDFRVGGRIFATLASVKEAAPKTTSRTRRAPTCRRRTLEDACREVYIEAR